MTTRTATRLGADARVDPPACDAPECHNCGLSLDFEGPDLCGPCFHGGSSICLGCRDPFTETTDPRGDFCQRCWDKLSMAAGMTSDDDGQTPF